LTEGRGSCAESGPSGRGSERCRLSKGCATRTTTPASLSDPNRVERGEWAEAAVDLQSLCISGWVGGGAVCVGQLRRGNLRVVFAGSVPAAHAIPRWERERGGVRWVVELERMGTGRGISNRAARSGAEEGCEEGTVRRRHVSSWPVRAKPRQRGRAEGFGRARTACCGGPEATPERRCHGGL
jgi:hypothetical protein